MNGTKLYFLGGMVLALCLFTPPAYSEEYQGPDALLKEAMDLGSQGNYQAAIEKARQAIEVKKVANNKRAHLYLGLMYFKTKQFDSSLSEFDLVTKMDINSPMAYYFTALIYESKALKEKDLASAQNFKDKALLSWEEYLNYTQEKEDSPRHENLGISVKKSVEQAKRHMKMLKEGLIDETE
jgi:tetratricopeptide (TPR) repeat protein